MSAFLTPLQVMLADAHANDGTGEWQLLGPLAYQSDLYERTFEVPTGFSTDFASVPKAVVLWGLFGGRYARPAVVHDWLCRDRTIPRHRADDVFLEAMRLENQLAIEAERAAGMDEAALAELASGMAGRASMMYAAVSAYTRSGLWKKEFDLPGYEVMG